MKFLIKHRFALAIIIVIITFFIIAPIVLPRYSTRLLMISLLMLVELYCWIIIKKGFPKLFNKKLLNAVVFIGFWLPLFSILVFVIVALFHPIHYWTPPIFVYVFGALITYYTAKLIFLVFLLISEIVFFFTIIFKWIFKQDIFLHNRFP